MASRDQWQQRVAQWKQSGLTSEVFAAQHGLNPRTLQWWSSALRRSPAPVEDLGFARLVAVAAQPSPMAEPAALELVLPSGYVVRVRRGFDPAVLRDLLAALEAS